MRKILSALLSLFLLCGCTNADVGMTTSAFKEEITQATQQTTAPEIKEERISFAAVGDNLLHNTVTYSAQIEKGKFDFSKIYSNIKPFIERYDLAFVNQEIPLGGVEYGLSGYPNFNGPAQAADGLFDAGFNIINLASNHSLDKGLKCLLASYNNIKNAGFDKIVGIFPDESKTEDFLMFEEKGIKIGMLSYSYGTNGMPIPKSNPNIVPIIDVEKITSDVGKLRDNCDVLIVSMHWGVEYTTSQTEEQKELAKTLNSLGVDVIIGHHPHVIEPVEEIVGTSGKKTLCFYSLGNFVSSQHNAATMLGGMAAFDIVRTKSGDIEMQNYGVLPIVTHYNKDFDKYTIYPLDSYTDEMAKAHGILKYDKKFSRSFLENLADKVLAENRLNIGDLND